MSRVKAILFDYDDTLMKTRETVYRVLKEVGKEFYGLDLTNEDIDKHYGKSYATLLSELYQSNDKFEVLHRNYMTLRTQTEIIAYEDSIPTIEQLSYLYLGIVTATVRDIVMMDLKKQKFPLKYLKIIQTSDDTKVHKPDPKVFEPVLKKLAKKKIKPEEMIYVGDDIRDYKAAIGAGLQFVGIARKETNPFAKHQITVINSLLQLADLV